MTGTTVDLLEKEAAAGNASVAQDILDDVDGARDGLRGALYRVHKLPWVCIMLGPVRAFEPLGGIALRRRVWNGGC